MKKKNIHNHKNPTYTYQVQHILTSTLTSLDTNHKMQYYFTCRHAIAVMHFNANLSRETRMKDGVEQYNIVYPKFMNGKAVVRKVTVKQNFGKLAYS